MTSPQFSKKRSFVVTLGLLTGLAAFTVDVSLPAVPAMVEALTTSLSRGQKIVGIFMLGMACGQISGKKERYGSDASLAERNWLFFFAPRSSFTKRAPGSLSLKDSLFREMSPIIL